MKFEYLLILFILFNVVTTFLARRAKKRKLEQEAAAAGPGDRPAARPRPQVRRLPGEGEGMDRHEEHEEDWAEHHGEAERPPVKDSPTLRDVARPPADPARKTGEAEKPWLPPQAREKAAELGKDLLTQLAKELGLQLPGSDRPQAPRPQEAPPRPAPAAAPPPREAPPARRPPPSWAATRDTRETSRDARETSRDTRERARETSETARDPRETARDAREQAREHRVHTRESRGPAKPAPSTLPVTPPIPATADAAFGSLSDPETLRRAFLLKTILDPPLSLRPRLPGSPRD